MPQTENGFQLIRALRGAPATVLLLLMMRGAAMTNKELCRWTGYSDKTMTDALGVLEQMRLAQYNGRTSGWSLSSGNQLVLPFAAQDGGLQQQVLTNSTPRSAGSQIADSPSPNELSTGPAEIGKFPIYGAGDRKISDLSGPSAAAAGDLDLRSSLRLSLQQQQSGGDRKISDLSLLVIHSGVREPARSLLLAGEPARVLAWWWSSLVDTDGMSNPLGWFIKRLQRGDAAPADLVGIAAVWLELPARRRRELAEANYAEAEAIWFELGLGPTSAELAYEVARAGGLNYAEW
jgi:hypothetical protein